MNFIKQSGTSKKELQEIENNSTEKNEVIKKIEALRNGGRDFKAEAEIAKLKIRIEILDKANSGRNY